MASPNSLVSSNGITLNVDYLVTVLYTLLHCPSGCSFVWPGWRPPVCTLVNSGSLYQYWLSNNAFFVIIYFYFSQGISLQYSVDVKMQGHL